MRKTPGDAKLDLLLLDNGLERQHSLCGDPRDRGSRQIAVLRERRGRGDSPHVHNGLAEGSTVRVRGPSVQILSSCSEGTCESEVLYGKHREYLLSGGY